MNTVLAAGAGPAHPGVPAAGRVSVIVPVHNGARHLLETLQSVAAQRGVDLELIVVDDGSTDGSAELVRASGLPVQLITQPRSYVSRARNRGLEAATGEYVCFLDQDDVWSPVHLAAQLGFLVAHPAFGAVVCPRIHWHASNGHFVRPALAEQLPPSAATEPRYTGWVYHEFLQDCWALTSATMIRRSALALSGAFDPSRPYSEDWDLWLRLSRVTQFAQLTAPAMLYRQHDQQGSRVPRPVDYRSELLLQTARLHGLRSRDGRQLSRSAFDAIVSRYQMEFGYQHLQHGDRWTGIRSLARAWRRQPARWRCLALAAGGALGWRPGATAIERDCAAA